MGATVEAARGRELTWKGFLGLVVAYLVVLRGTGLLVGVEVEGESPMPTVEVALRNFVVPIGCSGLFGAAVVTWLGWWPQVVRDRRPVRRWVWFVPVFMLVVALASIDYGHLADQTAGLVLALVAVGVVVGFSEELWFRGIGVTVFRRGGLSEGHVALWSSLIFGAVHISNAFGEGPQAIAQALVVSTSGYFFYLTLRAGGVIFLPMLVHGLWDFSLLSSQVGAETEAWIGTFLPIVAQVVLIVVILPRRHKTG
jgi:uncharacterized protein